jgi:GTP pyrophosphokinase
MLFTYSPQSQDHAMLRGAAIVVALFTAISVIVRLLPKSTASGRLRSSFITATSSKSSHLCAQSQSGLAGFAHGQARSKIRYHLKPWVWLKRKNSVKWPSLCVEGIQRDRVRDDEAYLGTWEKILRFTGNKSREELMIDIGMGAVFQHGCQANRHPAC